MSRAVSTLALVVFSAGMGCAGQAAQQEETTPAPAEASATPVASAEPACAEHEMAGEPGATASDVQSERVTAAVQAYLSDSSDLAGTFDIPGPEYGVAVLERFVIVSHSAGGFVTRGLFRGADHQYEVEFALSGGCDLSVVSADLYSVDGALQSTASN
jgi:hypothetical protein